MNFKLLLASALLLPNLALAQAAPDTPPPAHARQTMKDRFEAANTSHDGKLTLDQARAANMKRIVEHFSEIDTANHGYVTLDDIKAWAQTQRHNHS